MTTTTNIHAIQNLLVCDMVRVREAEEAIETMRQRLDSWTDADGVDPMQLRRDFDEVCAQATQARQSFSARTEMLQHIDLGDTTTEQLIASAVVTSGGGGGVYGPGGSPAAGTDPDPEVTGTLRTASSVPTSPVPAAGPGSAARTIDQDVREFLNAHNTTNPR